MLNMLNFGAKIKSIMVFLKKAIPEFRNKAKCKTFLVLFAREKKIIEVSLVLKQRLGATWIWPRLTGFVDPL